MSLDGNYIPKKKLFTLGTNVCVNYVCFNRLYLGINDSTNLVILQRHTQSFEILLSRQRGGVPRPSKAIGNVSDELVTDCRERSFTLVGNILVRGGTIYRDTAR